MNPHLEFAIRTFGLRAGPEGPSDAAALPAPAPGEILAVTGASGVGKSRALAGLAAATAGARFAHVLSPAELERPVLSLFDASLPSVEVLRALARVGLADARLWTQTAATLSAGELRRLEVARALLDVTPGSMLVLDEPDAHLDDTTAKVLAVALRRVAIRHQVRLVLSTHRHGLLPWLGPSRLFCIEDGVARELEPPRARGEHALLDEFAIFKGRAGDFTRFARWHYLGRGRPGPSALTMVATHRGAPAAVAVFSWPHLLLGPRRLALPEAYWPQSVARYGAMMLNRDVRMLSRVVVDPRFRGIGLAARLISRGVDELCVPYVECLAQMGAFSGFLLGAGFERVGDCAKPAPVCRLQRFMDEHGVAAAEITDPLRRNLLLDRLGPQAREEMHRLLRAVLRMRIETGHGSLRGRDPFARPEILERLLERLHSQPTYFLRSC